MAKQNTPFRYDYVGSFLRPEALKEARSKYEAGTITKEELTSVEDQESAHWLKNRRQQDTKCSQTESSEDQPGIWISCGDLTESDTAKQRQDFRSTGKQL